MRPERLFGVNPAKRPLTSLEAIVEDWNWRYIEGDAKKYRDTVTDYCVAAIGFGEAVQRACRCRNQLGKKHNHQSKVQDVTLDKWAEVLLLNLKPESIRDFDHLFDVMSKCVIKGIGPLTLYDVATRIGAYLRMQPEQLYLHAGVLIGWKALHGKGKWPNRLPRICWPEALRHLPADQVEDLLCTYSNFFNVNMI